MWPSDEPEVVKALQSYLCHEINYPSCVTRRSKRTIALCNWKILNQRKNMQLSTMATLTFKLLFQCLSCTFLESCLLQQYAGALVMSAFAFGIKALMRCCEFNSAKQPRCSLTFRNLRNLERKMTSRCPLTEPPNQNQLEFAAGPQSLPLKRQKEEENKEARRTTRNPEGRRGSHATGGCVRAFFSQNSGFPKHWCCYNRWLAALHESLRTTARQEEEEEEKKYYAQPNVPACFTQRAGSAATWGLIL